MQLHTRIQWRWIYVPWFAFCTYFLMMFHHYIKTKQQRILLLTQSDSIAVPYKTLNLTQIFLNIIRYLQLLHTNISISRSYNLNIVNSFSFCKGTAHNFICLIQMIMNVSWEHTCAMIMQCAETSWEDMNAIAKKVIMVTDFRARVSLIQRNHKKCKAERAIT